MYAQLLENENEVVQSITGRHSTNIVEREGFFSTNAGEREEWFTKHRVYAQPQNRTQNVKLFKDDSPKVLRK